MATNKETLTWEDFLTACQTLEELSKNFEENWKLVIGRDSNDVGGSYLKYTCMRSMPQSQQITEAPDSEEDTLEHQVIEEEETVATAQVELTSGNSKIDALVKCEYHIVFNMSYSVPVLYFNISRSDGSLLKLDEIWSMFLGKEKTSGEMDMWTTLSQQDHPILNLPFFTIHPCHTSQLMGTLWNNAENPSLSYLITWLSIFGSRLGLRISNELAKYVAPSEK